MKGPFNKKIGALLFAVVAIAAVVWIRISLGEMDAARAVGALRGVQDRWWALPVYFGCYVALTSAFFPALLLHMAVGAVYGFPAGLLINLVTFNVTASLQFAVARRAGRERVAAFLARRRVTALDDLSRAHGFLGVVLIRFLPIPTAAVAAGLGVSPVRWRDFALGSLVGASSYTAVYTYFAAALVEGEPGAEQEVRWRLAVSMAGVVALALGTAFIRARLARGNVRP
ncbi:MAG TPA: VTT domain-containing protein [Myxococcales bacterium]|nr:VTT domain-containing protein [Myxococcales bacterium]